MAWHLHTEVEWKTHLATRLGPARAQLTAAQALQQQIVGALGKLLDARPEGPTSVERGLQHFTEVDPRGHGLAPFLRARPAEFTQATETYFRWDRPSELAAEANAFWPALWTHLSQAGLQTRHGRRTALAAATAGQETPATAASSVSESFFAGAPLLSTLFGEDLEFATESVAGGLAGRTRAHFWVQGAKERLESFWTVAPPPVTPVVTWRQRLWRWWQAVRGRTVVDPWPEDPFPLPGDRSLPRSEGLAASLWEHFELRQNEARQLRGGTAHWEQAFASLEATLASWRVRFAAQIAPLERHPARVNLAEARRLQAEFGQARQALLNLVATP